MTPMTFVLKCKKPVAPKEGEETVRYENVEIGFSPTSLLGGLNAAVQAEDLLKGLIVSHAGQEFRPKEAVLYSRHETVVKEFKNK